MCVYVRVCVCVCVCVCVYESERERVCVCVCIYYKGNDADSYMVPDAAALLDIDEEESGGAKKRAMAPAAEGAQSAAGAQACCFTRDLAHPELLQFARFLHKKKGSLQNAEQEAEMSTPPGLFGSVELVGGGGLEERAMECPRVLAALAQVCSSSVYRSLLTLSRSLSTQVLAPGHG